MKCSLLPSFTILLAACSSTSEEQSSTWRPPKDQGLRYSCEFMAVPEGASSLHVHIRVPEGLELSSGDGLLGNAPLAILAPIFIADEDEAQSTTMTIGVAEITWTNVVEPSGLHLELDIAMPARPLELNLHLLPRTGTTVDIASLRGELDGGMVVLADGKPILAAWTRLERSSAVTRMPASAPR